ncbi:hypothetical protein FA95DRAFT_1574739 [Auriscalpium vulgare]|uniref:Uncharacterized protein n=1 Tax=Auriscalpium vulgare TaxID=40419 RepID=A0ACB8RJP1_9AGAM|nr:hypothetical protein FA95DRAFT_1574739 [Auriscalpium vulgare]
MLRYTLSALFALLPATQVLAQKGGQPLASARYKTPADLPYQVEPDAAARGSQYGYNICNSTTENQQSLCQTMYVNSIADFCLWAPDKPNSLIADTEGEEVAWCTRKGHGTRLIPDGTLQGVQFLTAPDYTLIVGYMDQTKVNLQSGDEGGELDPHGQDLRGNPMGGMVYSTVFSGSNTTVQVPEWNLFIGGDFFCLKICKNDKPGGFCNNIYDTKGCGFNSPSNSQKGVYESCYSDNMQLPGADPNPVPASSKCTQYASTDLYGMPTATTAPASTTTSSAHTSATSASLTASAGVAAKTGSPNGARAFGVSLLVGVAGIVLSIVFLA